MKLSSFQDAAMALQQAGVVGVLPTDTVYGLVARASDPAAVKRLYALKSREHKPGTLIAANVDQLAHLGLKPRYLKAVIDYWPGPISIIIPCGPELAYLHDGLDSLAVRLPDDSELVKVLLQTGPLLTSSANLPGQPVANTVSEADAYFGEQVDFYVDEGDLSGNLPSTIVHVIDDAIEVLRQGAVKIAMNAPVDE
ncbi:MAG TPA: L-threonylcarbamoyladenylate synthase [Candidatus Saccharimonadales bacterium]|nr:L-threonylcarbamoyladenylate synthase [Candidatus Saccharimonadales bacterium]